MVGWRCGIIRNASILFDRNAKAPGGSGGFFCGISWILNLGVVANYAEQGDIEYQLLITDY